MRNLTMRWTAVACCALSACLLAPVAARAQGSPPPAQVEDDGAGDNARAAQLYREGNLAFDQKRWSDAELLYLKAWALMRSFDIAANLGHAQLKLNKPRSAAAFFAFALRMAPPSVKPDQRARIRGFLDQAKAQVGTVRVRVKNVADAEVFLDGERVPEEEAKHEIYVEPGEHRIVIRHAGYEDEHLGVLAAPASTETVTPELKPKAEKAPVAAGPGGKGPEAAASGAASAPGMGEAMPKAPAAGAQMEERRSWAPVIALGAASAVGLGMAVGFTVASNGASADVDKRGDAILQTGGQCRKPSAAFVSPCDELDSALRRIDTFGNGARLAYVASGALAISAAAYALWGQPRETRTSRIRALPELRTDGAGFAVLGVW